MKQKIYIGAAAILMAGIFLLAGGKPVAAKAEKIKKVKIASAEKTVLINKKEKIKLKAKVKPASMKKKDSFAFSFCHNGSLGRNRDHRWV